MADPVATNPDADGLVGQIIIYGGETLPGPKYRWCHGTQTLSRTEFSLCFSRLGELWGAGDGTTTFGLPNFDKVFPVGVDSSGADAAYDKVGDAGGSALGAVSVSVPASGLTVTGQSTVAVNATAPNDNAQGNTSTLGVGGTASGTGTAATIPPYKAVRFIVKVA
jgi:microcystin-dependent protein